MVLDLSYVHSGLKGKGFEIEKGGDHYYCRYFIDGEIFTNIRSKVGGHSKRKYKTLNDVLLAQIQRTLHFDDKRQFFEFLECPFTQENYQKMLINKELIQHPSR